VIQIRAMAREPGYRSKVAVSSSDPRVDCVGACVGVRGNRIKNIVDELGGERIDIVRWDDSLEVLIPNALQPAEVEQVILCKMLGRAIVLVREDQLSLAIGRRGQNVRLASKLCVAVARISYWLAALLKPSVASSAPFALGIVNLKVANSRRASSCSIVSMRRLRGRRELYADAPNARGTSPLTRLEPNMLDGSENDWPRHFQLPATMRSTRDCE
jgi:hypothetical protein